MNVQQLEDAYLLLSVGMFLVMALFTPGQVTFADDQSSGAKALIVPLEPTVDENELTLDSAMKAVNQYIAELEEIDRVAALRKAEAKTRLDMSLQQLEQFETESDKRYHGMLGSYFNHQGRIPFIMLSVPNGENVIGEKFRSTLNAADYDSAMQLYKFEAVGHVLIPRDGSYRLQVGRAGGIKLNGMSYAVGSPTAGQPPYADVDLTQGVYKVSYDVGNNGGQLAYAMIRIIDNELESELPIFIYESELETFQNDLSLGVELSETSHWKRKDNKIK